MISTWAGFLEVFIIEDCFAGEIYVQIFSAAIRKICPLGIDVLLVQNYCIKFAKQLFCFASVSLNLS